MSVCLYHVRHSFNCESAATLLSAVVTRCIDYSIPFLASAMKSMTNKVQLILNAAV